MTLISPESLERKTSETGLRKGLLDGVAGARKLRKRELECERGRGLLDGVAGALGGGLYDCKIASILSGSIASILRGCKLQRAQLLTSGFSISLL